MQPHPATGTARFLANRWAADALTWLVVCGSVVFLPGARPLRDGLTPRYADAIAVLALTVAVALSRRLPLVAAAIPTAVSFAVNPALYYEDLLVAQVVLAFLLGRRTRLVRTGLLLLAGICVAAVAVSALGPGTVWVTGQRAATSAVLAVLLPWLVGRYLRQRDELIRTGWALAERMEHERDLADERARMRERSRIAGDIHDSVGHELSLIALRAAAIEVDPTAGDPARRAAAELRGAAAHATSRLHDTIAMLRDDSEAGPVVPADEPLAALLERARGSGVPIAVTGALPPLPPASARAAYRVAQEALTNAAKHAPGMTVTVQLGVDPAAAEALLTVANALPGPSAPGGAGGFGLVGLDERVRRAGGRLTVRSGEGAFAVTARLPLAEDRAAVISDR